MGIKMTASCSLGKTAIGHDNRIFVPENVDSERSINNEYLIKCQTVREAYEEIFGAAVSDYNDKQKRKDRKITSYYDKIRDSKNGEHLTYEYVLQVGSRESNPTGGQWEKESKEIYRKWLDDFTSNNANLKVINASIHCDEPNGTPHMHITIVPVAHYSRGLALRNSLSGAMKEMGFTRAADWCLDVQKELGELLREKGFEYVKLGTHREHIENGLYQELMDKEQAKIDKDLEDSYKELKTVREEAAELQSEIDRMDEQKFELIMKEDSLKDDIMDLEKERVKLEQTVSSLDRKVQEKQSLIWKLENRVKELLTTLKTKVNGVIDSLTVINTKKRLEKTLEHMPAGTVNEFRDKWNMYGNELPCFRLQYDPPTREKIEKEYFSPWKPLLDGEDYGFFNRTRAAEEFSGLIRNGDFDEGEANWIIRVIGGTEYAEKKDIERSINVAYQIAKEHYAERVEATTEDLKRKLLAEIKITDKDEREWDYF